MLFRDLDHRLVMALHAPNHSPCERMELRVVEETASGLRLPGRWRHWLRGVRVPGAGR